MPAKQLRGRFRLGRCRSRGARDHGEGPESTGGRPVLGMRHPAQTQMRNEASWRGRALFRQPSGG
jgi:hypothetical protein